MLLGWRDALHVWLTPVQDLQPAPGRIHLGVRLDTAEARCLSDRGAAAARQANTSVPSGQIGAALLFDRL